MFRKLFAGITSWLLIDAAAQHFGCRCLKGPWWTLHLIGGSEQIEEVIKHDLTLGPPATIEQLVSADFPRDKRSIYRVHMLHVPPDIGMRAFAKEMGLDDIHEARYDESEGFYVTSARLGILTGLPGSNDFRDTLIHELSHAYCHLALGACPKIPWASEGYTELVVARVACLAGNAVPTNLRRHLEYIVNLIDSGQLLPLIDVVKADRSSRLVSGYPGFQAHSAMLTFMLALAGRHNAQLLYVCRKAIKGRGTSCDEVVRWIEECTGVEMAEIHNRFVEFCTALINDVLPQPRIVEPETMFKVAGHK